MLHNNGFGNHPSCITYKVFEQGKFTGLQVNLFIRSGNLAFKNVHREISKCQASGLSGAAGSADKCLYPCKKLRKRKWLSQVVVAPCLKPFNPSIHGTLTAQDDNGSIHLLPPKLFNKAQTIQFRQHYVYDCSVVGLV